MPGTTLEQAAAEVARLRADECRHRLDALTADPPVVDLAHPDPARLARTTALAALHAAHAARCAQQARRRVDAAHRRYDAIARRRDAERRRRLRAG